MIIWVDAHLSPAIAAWITTNFGITAFASRDIGLRDAEDPEIFEAAKTQEVIMLTKDSDFVDLADRFEAPPQIIGLTCGNTSNARLREILNATLLLLPSAQHQLMHLLPWQTLRHGPNRFVIIKHPNKLTRYGL
jgi:predicted nuclease of predicted toxin-antitoxin system